MSAYSYVITLSKCHDRTTVPKEDVASEVWCLPIHVCFLMNTLLPILTWRHSHDLFKHS